MTPEEQTMEEQACEQCPKMTYKQRIIGFCACCGLGYLLSFMGYLSLAAGGMTNANIRTFVALYVLGNFIAIAATLFVIGPKKQCKKMFDTTRRKTTIFWLCTLLLVLVLALAKAPVFLVFLALVVQIGASVWYSASYIPYGRRMIIRCCQASLFKPCPEACKPVETFTGA